MECYTPKWKIFELVERTGKRATTSRGLFAVRAVADAHRTTLRADTENQLEIRPLDVADDDDYESFAAGYKRRAVLAKLTPEERAILGVAD